MTDFDFDSLADQADELFFRCGWQISLSVKSRSRYWSWDRDYPCVRISDHDEAYDSGCPVLVGGEDMIEATLVMGRDGWLDRLKTAAREAMESHYRAEHARLAEDGEEDPEWTLSDQLAAARRRHPMLYEDQK